MNVNWNAEWDDWPPEHRAWLLEKAAAHMAAMPNLRPAEEPEYRPHLAEAQ
jgi:hypothetical protein